ncbi:MAG: helix-turn-helix transcriptional regulator [Saprospiraceae bacterium]|nr:helix-turn-helix transcriptional regulator [Saprospiraceae bacterium]
MEQKHLDQGIRLKKLLRALDINQVSFAKSVGMAQPNISKMMNGERQLSLDVLYRISDKYHVNLHWLLTGVGEMFLDEVQKRSSEVNEDASPYKTNRLEELEEGVEQIEKIIRQLKNNFSKNR